jgi:putative transcriptional regulator
MKTVRMTMTQENLASRSVGRINAALVDATTEADLVRQAAADEADAMQDAGRFVRRVRRRLGLSQAEFSERIDVPLETIRNWEQGKRSPTGAAKSLLNILDRAPKAALAALYRR